MSVKRVKPVMLKCSTASLCSRPYERHRHGCPNFGKRKGCPPIQRWRNHWIEARTFMAIWNVFPFGEHVKKMRKAHPDWSKRQVECCLYWQGTARKQLRAKVDEFKKKHGSSWKIYYVPEAFGLNVTATMAKIGVHLEWPPRKVTYQVAIAVQKRRT